MTPAAIRAMRGALDWTMRDLAGAAGVALGTVLKAEQGGGVTQTTARRLRAAFRSHSVSCRQQRDQVIIVLGAATVSEVKQDVAKDLQGLPYVSVRGPREDGTYRVLFEVPARLRPESWPPTRPLPFTHERTGDLSNPREVAAIRKDAETLSLRLQKARLEDWRRADEAQIKS